MRESFTLSRRAALVLVAAVCGASTTIVAAGPVVPSNAALTARVKSTLDGSAAGLTGDTKESTDVGSLAKSTASAAADANALDGAGDVVKAPGTADTDIATSSDGFTITGSTTGGLLAGIPFAAEIDAVTNAAVDFSVDDSSLGKINYDIAIDDTVAGNSKVTLILNQLAGEGGAESELFRTIFTETTAGAMPDVASGFYRIIAVTGTETTTKGVPGETESARLSLSVGSADAPAAAAPLPAPVLGGTAMLLAAGAAYARARVVGFRG